MTPEIGLDGIRAAASRLAEVLPPTPVVGLEDGERRILLKLEMLQPIASFKVRGAYNAMASLPPDALARGVYTASMGNMAQGVGWAARRLGVRCAAVVPDMAPENKLRAIRGLGAEVVTIPYTDWWQVLVDDGYGPLDQERLTFIHPFADPGVIAGHATCGLEIVDQVPDARTVIVPFGGGGLITGIASALRAVAPDARVLAVEVETAAALAAALRAGRPVEVEYTGTFVDGMGSRGVTDRMWPLVSSLVEESRVVRVADVAAAVRRLLERNRIVAEGAGAASVAAALADASLDPVVCVVSGGNIDTEVLMGLMREEDRT